MRLARQTPHLVWIGVSFNLVSVKRVKKVLTLPHKASKLAVNGACNLAPLTGAWKKPRKNCLTDKREVTKLDVVNGDWSKG